jgi:glycosyltransferase involved in cell wall biosynthesis
VDPGLFHPGPADPAFVAELDAAGRPVVLSARHLHPVYNQETIVAAFSRVLREIPDALLVLRLHSSDPAYLATLQRRIEDCGLRSSIRPVGTLPYERLGELYRLAHVTVSVPFSDGTPMSVLEAMACGSAPVVSDLPSLKEWIRDGWNGDLVHPNDSSTLATRIVRLLEDAAVRSAYAKRNLEIVQTRATQHANMATMEALYREIQHGSPQRLAQQTVA